MLLPSPSSTVYNVILPLLGKQVRHQGKETPAGARGGRRGAPGQAFLHPDNQRQVQDKRRQQLDGI